MGNLRMKITYKQALCCVLINKFIIEKLYQIHIKINFNGEYEHLPVSGFHVTLKIGMIACAAMVSCFIFQPKCTVVYEL